MNIELLQNVIVDNFTKKTFLKEVNGYLYDNELYYDFKNNQNEVFLKEDLLKKISNAYNSCTAEGVTDEDTFITAVGGMLNLYYGSQSNLKNDKLIESDFSAIISNPILVEDIINIIEFIELFFENNEPMEWYFDTDYYETKFNKICSKINDIYDKNPNITYTKMYYYILKMRCLCKEYSNFNRGTDFDRKKDIILEEMIYAFDKEFFSYITGTGREFTNHQIIKGEKKKVFSDENILQYIYPKIKLIFSKMKTVCFNHLHCPKINTETPLVFVPPKNRYGE